MKAIKKAVIPAAGLGTRFLPATKSTPKEMLPVVDKPILFYVVEEAIAAGIEDIVIIAGRQKTSIEDFFDRSYELEDTLEKTGKTELLETINSIRNMANIISVRQKQALGLGHAIYCSKPVVGDEPFAVLLGDEIMISENNEPTVTQQLANTYYDTKLSSVAVMPVDISQVHKYGIVKPSTTETNKPFGVESLIEKPSAEEAPSQFALPGRYVFDSKILDYLKDAKPGKNNEIQLTDSMNLLAQKDGLMACPFKAKRYDAGDKLGYLMANVELALKHSELKDEFKAYLKTLAGQL